jgi:hypothetical protein
MFLVAILIAWFATAAQAATVKYEFIGLNSPDGITVHFTYTSLDFITSLALVGQPAGWYEYDSCSVLCPPNQQGLYSCGRTEIQPDYQWQGLPYDLIGVGITGYSSLYFLFADGTFSTLGTFDSVPNNPSARLIITDVGSPAPVPLPPSSLLFGTGLVGLIGYQRLKTHRRA